MLASRFLLAPRFVLALGLVAATLPLGHAEAAAWSASGDGACTGEWVLSSLRGKVHERVTQNSEGRLSFHAISNATTTYQRQRDAYHNVGRDFCHAKVYFSNGSPRDLWYLIERPWGFAGAPGSSNLEFCIAGLDPLHIYGKDCSTIRDSRGW